MSASFNLPALLVVLGIGACAGHPPVTAPAPVPAPAPGSTSNPLYRQFLGAWTGQLEYRDFQSNEQVFLPTWLTMSETADHQALALDLIYDDGPTKTVRERLMIALGDGTAELSSDRDRSHEHYQVAGLAEFSKLGRGVLTLTGAGQENQHPVDVRITLTLRRNLFTLLKETAAAGEALRFRDRYTFTRATPPSL